uniref:Uncharacterized protein n=1 Tax=Ditylenchus dipsaci TaxID=166011 RepID=A0A915EUB1_9BILA
MDLQDLIAEPTEPIPQAIETTNTSETNFINETSSSTIPIIQSNLYASSNDHDAQAPWWMFVLMGGAIILAIFSLALLVVGQKKKEKRMKMQTILAPMGDNHHKYGASVKEILTTDDKPTGQMKDTGRDQCGQNNQQIGIEKQDNEKHSINYFDGDRSETESIQTEASGTVKRATTPTKTATKVQIDADVLSTDKLDSGGKE